MLQRTAEYALRIAIALARQPNGASTSQDLAKATRVPRRYLQKVLQELIREGLVRSQPGPGGGYSLAAEPARVTLLDVVAAIQPIERIGSCPLGLKSHSDLCPLHKCLDEAYAAVEAALGSVTLAAMLQSSGPISPLLETPARLR